MPINIQITNPPLNGSPLPAILTAQIFAFGAGDKVMFVLVDEADGNKTNPPLMATTGGGGIYQAPTGGFPIAGHFYTVVVVAVTTDAAGNIINSGSDAKIKCKA